MARFNYRRSRVEGATFYFTVMAYRHRLILDHVDAGRILGDAVREVCERHPFPIDAWVLLPDHLYCIWTLPLGDADCSGRWSLIK